MLYIFKHVKFDFVCIINVATIMINCQTHDIFDKFSKKVAILKHNRDSTTTTKRHYLS